MQIRKRPINSEIPRFNLDLARAWLGNVRSQEDALRTLIRLNRQETGSRLFSTAANTEINHMLQGSYPLEDIVRVAFQDIYPRMDAYVGTLSAVVSDAGARTSGWYKQGHTAAAAIIACEAGEPGLAQTQMEVLIEQADEGGPYGVEGLTKAGDRNGGWEGWWRYAREGYPFEDATQVANAVALDYFGYDIAPILNTMSRIALRHNGAIPYVVNNNGDPMWGRTVAPAAFSTEETARVAMLLQASHIPVSEPPEAPVWSIAASACRNWLRSVASEEGYWPRFIEPGTGRPCWPQGDPDRNLRFGLGEHGLLTYDPSEAVRGYHQPTTLPRMAFNA